MNTTQSPAPKLGNSNGGKKYDASTKPTAARMLPRALARDAGNSSHKGAPGKSMAEKGDQTSQRPKPKPDRTKAPHSKVAASSPEKPVVLRSRIGASIRRPGLGSRE